MARPHPTPQKHVSPNANPNGTAQQTADLTKRCACAVKSSSYISTRFLAISHESDTSRFHPKPTPKASPNGTAIETSYGRLQTVADGCEHENNVGQTQLNPQTPKLNKNPSLRIRGKVFAFRSLFPYLHIYTYICIHTHLYMYIYMV